MRVAIVMSFLAFVIASFILPNRGYIVGDSVKDFSLKNIDGNVISLSSFKDNQGVIVIFDCNTCPVSKAYTNRIIDLSKKYDHSFPLVAINSNDPVQSEGDSFEDMVVQAKDKGYSFPYLVDETQEVAKTFGATNTPHVFLLKKSGQNYSVAYIGAIDNNARNASLASKRYVELAIEALISGKAVEISKTKTIGCGIRWK